MKYRAKCAEVIDGDTFITTEGVHVRLANVNCPELGEYGSKKAASDLSQRILNRTVIVEPVGKSYGRTVANVWVYGTNVNSAMRRRGYK